MSPLFEKLAAFGASLGIPVLEKMGDTFLEDTLQKFHDTNKEEYEADMPLLHASLTRLKKFTDATVTEWDDPFVDTILLAITKSAAKNGLSLVTVVAPVPTAADDQTGTGSDTPPVPPTKPE